MKEIIAALKTWKKHYFNGSTEAIEAVMPRVDELILLEESGEPGFNNDYLINELKKVVYFKDILKRVDFLKLNLSFEAMLVIAYVARHARDVTMILTAVKLEAISKNKKGLITARDLVNLFPDQRVPCAEEFDVLWRSQIINDEKNLLDYMHGSVLEEHIPSIRDISDSFMLERIKNNSLNHK